MIAAAASPVLDAPDTVLLAAWSLFIFGCVTLVRRAGDRW